MGNFYSVRCLYFACDPVKYTVFMHETNRASTCTHRDQWLGGVIANSASKFLTFFGVVNPLLGALEQIIHQLYYYTISLCTYYTHTIDFHFFHQTHNKIKLPLNQIQSHKVPREFEGIIFIIFNLMSRENTEQQLRKEINDLENQIFDLQTFYLENTRDSGNLMKGFDNYLNARAPRNQISKKPKIQNVERLFSLTSVRSKTSEAFDQAFLGEKHDSNQVLPKRNRIRNNTKGKGYNMVDVDSADNNSGSGDIVYSMDESSNNLNNKGRKKKSRIPSGGKGTRK